MTTTAMRTERRDALDGARRGAERRRPTGTASLPAAAQPRRRGRRAGFSALVMMFAAGLVATLALPSYAIDPTRGGDALPVAGRDLDAAGQQHFAASGQVQAADVARDTFSATASAVLERQAYAKQFASYTGPSAEDYVKNPKYPSFSLASVYNTALQYQGVPYVFGGADPSGFDCSGFVMFVYAQYGVSLPHSVREQDAIGEHISEADAVPGDVVVFDGDAHDGFYAGNGMILHAPFPGAEVRVQPIWTAAVHFIRFGVSQ